MTRKRIIKVVEGAPVETTGVQGLVLRKRNEPPTGLDTDNFELYVDSTPELKLIDSEGNEVAFTSEEEDPIAMAALGVHEGEESDVHGATGAVFGLGDNPNFTSTEGIVLPRGTTAQRGTETEGKIRYDTELKSAQVFQREGWNNIVGETAEVQTNDFTALRNRTYLVDTSSGDVTVLLDDTAVTEVGSTIKILKISNDSNNITITPEASNTIDDKGIAESISISAVGAWITLVADGVNAWRTRQKGLGVTPSFESESFTAVPGKTYICDTTSGAVDVQLPASVTGSIIGVYRNGPNNVTITPASGEAIDNDPIDEAFVIDIDSGWVVLYGDGTGWVSELPAVIGPSLLDANNTWTGTNTFTQFMNINNQAAGQAAGVSVNSENTTINFVSSGSSLIGNRLGVPISDSGQIYTLGGPLALGTFNNNNLTLSTNNTARVTILNSGNVGIGTSSPGAAFQIGDASPVVDGQYRMYHGGSGVGVQLVSQGSGSRTFSVFYRGHSLAGADLVGSIVGDLTNRTIGFVNGSDSRLKTNITPASPQLDKINQINLVEYNWTDSLDGPKKLGVLAQELNDIYPDAVNEGSAEGPDDENFKMWGVDYTQMLPHALKAIQELSAQNDELKARIEVLEAK